MKGWARWKIWGSILTVLCLIVGIDLVNKPEKPRPTNYSLIDAVSAATKPGLSVVGLVASDYEQLAHPVSRDAALSEAQVEEMVRYAVALAGDLRQRIEPDAEWVVIKVNIVELKEGGSGVITDWRVVKALIKIVHEIVPQARVTIAEGPAEWIPPGSPEVQVGGEIERQDGFAMAGYRQLLEDPDLEGVDLDILDVNFDEVAEVSVPDGGYAQDQWKLPLSVLECDFLISAPVLKIHDTITMTNAMKNFIGVAPGMVYGWAKMSGYPPRSGNPGIPHNAEILDETIVDLVAACEPDFAVVDAIMCMERAKTDKFGGVPVRMNTILASADVVAADAISARLIGLNPFDIEYLTLAAYKGLGQVDPEYIKVKGSPLEQVAARFEKTPSGWGRGHYGQGCRTWVLKGPFARQQGKAGEEFIDVNDPQALPGQNGWSPAVYFHDDRIDLDKYYDDPFDCVVYAYAVFEAENDQTAELWLGSDEGLKGCLNFLGEELLSTRLMGLSGHAFRFSMADSLDWSGSSRVDLSEMAKLYANLGYRVRAITAPEDDPDFARKQQESWEAIEASIDRGVPVVARLGWGHQLIVGYHPKKEQYYAVGSRGGLRPYELDELGASDRRSGGGLEVLLLEERHSVDPRAAERSSLRFAIEEAHRPDVPGTPYHSGFRGFERWIADIEAGSVTNERGPGYTGGLVTEARTAAAPYLREIASNYSGKTAESLNAASACYDREAKFLEELAAMFPFRGRVQVDLQDPRMREKVATLVREAYSWEQKAAALLEEALAEMR